MQQRCKEAEDSAEAYRIHCVNAEEEKKYHKTDVNHFFWAYIMQVKWQSPVFWGKPRPRHIESHLVYKEGQNKIILFTFIKLSNNGDNKYPF